MKPVEMLPRNRYGYHGLEFRAFQISLIKFELTLDMTKNVKGRMIISPKNKISYQSSESDKSFISGMQWVFRDEDGLPVEYKSVEVDYHFDRSSFAMSTQIANVEDKIAYWGAAFIPVVLVASQQAFDFTINILQQFLYFKVIKIPFPNNINNTFKILGSWTLLTSFSNVDFDDAYAEYDKPQNWFDVLCGLTMRDYAPPENFKDLKLPTMFLKTGVFSLIIIAIIYFMMIKLSQIKFKNSTLAGIQRKFIWTGLIKVVFMYS
jgi:hypothetical protein